MTWRHNSVLSYLVKRINEVKPPTLEVFADLPDHTINGATIPPDIICTEQRPDLVLLDRSNKKIEVLELT